LYIEYGQSNVNKSVVFLAGAVLDLGRYIFTAGINYNEETY